MLDFQARRNICEDTIARSAEIAASIPGASLDSIFISSQLPPLAKSRPDFPNLFRKPIEIHNSDSFALARNLKPSVGKIGVLNLASNYEVAGGWRQTISKTQEEALCYSSTLYATLRPEWYPWPNLGPGSCGGIFSPDVVVFKDTLDSDCVELGEQHQHVLAIITVAAPCAPKLAHDGENFARESDLRDLRERILLVLRIAATNKVTNLVLGAMGCGAYRCPPSLVAREMKSALESDEFEGWFECVDFAVYAAGPMGKRNLEVFKEIFEHAQQPSM
jgi:uncharacterized protein (TIGR02452 family)